MGAGRRTLAVGQWLRRRPRVHAGVAAEPDRPVAEGVGDSGFCQQRDVAA